jgi:GNAT superfamily N-acetyltransferase
MDQVRLGDAAEIPTYVQFWYWMLDECDLLGSGAVPDWKERLSEHFRRQMKGGHMQWFVAEADGRIVGTAMATLSSGRSNILLDLQAMLAGVYVLREYRGRGIARELTERSIAWCKDRGCVRIRLNASKMGRPLYESLGFVPATEMMRLDLR